MRPLNPSLEGNYQLQPTLFILVHYQLTKDIKLRVINDHLHYIFQGHNDIVSISDSLQGEISEFFSLWRWK